MTPDTSMRHQVAPTLNSGSMGGVKSNPSDEVLAYCGWIFGALPRVTYTNGNGYSEFAPFTGTGYLPPPEASRFPVGPKADSGRTNSVEISALGESARLGALNEVPQEPCSERDCSGFHVKPNFGLSVRPKSLYSSQRPSAESVNCCRPAGRSKRA